MRLSPEARIVSDALAAREMTPEDCVDAMLATDGVSSAYCEHRFSGSNYDKSRDVVWECSAVLPGGYQILNAPGATPAKAFVAWIAEMAKIERARTVQARVERELREADAAAAACRGDDGTGLGLEQTDPERFDEATGPCPDCGCANDLHRPLQPDDRGCAGAKARARADEAQEYPGV